VSGSLGCQRSFTLTVHEISLIKEPAVRVKTDDNLSTFVRDGENALSCERTP